jgi:hypothetical protein
MQQIIILGDYLHYPKEPTWKNEALTLTKAQQQLQRSLSRTHLNSKTCAHEKEREMDFHEFLYQYKIEK